ncbi:MAG TPA: Npun_F0813 family protein [Trichocoleus sp.]|jgi:hypothetical protein
MFILKRQDVEISSIQHPKKDQQIPILQYQGQTFRLINVFSAAQEEDAKAFWRDLTDNRGKACVLLEEPDRYSVWGKVRLDQLGADTPEPQANAQAAIPGLIQAGLLLLQGMYIDIEDLLGARQGSSFQKDITAVFQQGRFPQTESSSAVHELLTADPLGSLSLPSWQEAHLNLLLQELYRLGKQYFGNTNFTERVIDVLQDLPDRERTLFFSWLRQSPHGKLWQS